MGDALCAPPGASVCVGVCVRSCLDSWESGRACTQIAVTCLRVCVCVCVDIPGVRARGSRSPI
jgi:hypothetical protein